MIEAAMIWNEPNNKSHWDPEVDPGWVRFADMATLAAKAIRAENPTLPRVLGGISPIDPSFIENMKGRGLLDHLEAIAVHGFPLDWNLWSIHEWPEKIAEIEAVTDLPVWVSEVGISTFRGRRGAGLGPAAHRRTADRPRPKNPLVQPLRPAARMGGDDAPPRGGGLVLLPAFPHGPAAPGRLPEAGARRIFPSTRPPWGCASGSTTRTTGSTTRSPG
jgi:hypothetical protein